jgi:SAM-dependent methyltransferase
MEADDDARGLAAMSVASAVDRANAEFWNELCGSWLARQAGITDCSLASLRRFDAAYFAFYPYLLDYLRPSRASGQVVVEIGLGYGSVGQQFLDAGARYTGIDLAHGPVRLMHARAGLSGRRARVLRASARSLPIGSSSVDALVSIGCFHHTGSLSACIDEAYRVLKPGGSALVMVYNRFSYRQWTAWPRSTWRAWRAERRGPSGDHAGNDDQRRRYDVDSAGRAAPETVFVSRRRLDGLFARFSSVEIATENNGDLLRWVPRRTLLTTLGRTAGLDLYVTARK